MRIKELLLTQGAIGSEVTRLSPRGIGALIAKGRTYVPTFRIHVADAGLREAISWGMALASNAWVHPKARESHDQISVPKGGLNGSTAWVPSFRLDTDGVRRVHNGGWRRTTGSKLASTGATARKGRRVRSGRRGP
jgi:hypothetical protein